MKKAINNTTVEVTFDEEVTDVKALDFAIEGLEISNAAVKQTNKKVVVLTTSAQTADVEYTVTLGEEKIGTFKGVSAVVPTKVELVSSSVQGKLGQQVSVQAKVTVASGQSAAGIPVTFSIPGNNNDGVVPTVTGEAVTNADGVATYTYTRYGVKEDTVTAYATGDRSKFAIGYVFWGVEQILTITEVTEGATISNGANKTYKITYKHPETGNPVSGKTFNVGFLENMNVSSDKKADASVNGVKALQLNSNTAPEAAKITTDSKGEATFTVSGTNAVVTPVVFNENNTAGENNKTYKASALQTTASKVTFSATQAEYKIELTREGGEVAATGAANGREYKVVVKDKDGKVAKNEIVNVAFNEDLDRVISTNTDSKFIDADNDVYYTNNAVDGMSAKQISVKTDDKGEATFVIGSEKVNDYATPVAWIDINTSNAKQGTLDEGEPKTVAPISYFQAAYLDGAAIKAYKENNLDKAVTKFDGAETAVFAAELVNQSGKKISNIKVKKATYTIFNTGSNDITVGGETISPNRSYTVTYDATLDSNGNVVIPAKNLEVKSNGKTTSVRVIATGVAINTDGKDYAFTAKEATASFTATDEVPNSYTGLAAQYNPLDSGTDSNSLWFAGKKPVKYAGVTGKTFKYFGSNGNEVFGEAAWEALLDGYDASNQNVTISYNVDGDNVTFKVITVGQASANAADGIQKYKVVAKNNAPVAKVVGDQTLAANNTAGLTFTATQVASDADTADTLKILTAYTSNASVATATVASDQLSFNVKPQAEGSTVVTLVVSDGKENVNVSFKVNVTAASYLSALNSGAPSIDYAPAATAAPKSVITVGSNTVTLAGTIDITADQTFSVPVIAGDDNAAIVAKIISNANLNGSEVTASVDASGNVVITRPTKGATSVLTVAATTAQINSAAPTITTTAGTNGTATAAKYSFEVKTAITAASGLTVEVKIGNETVTLVEGTDFNGAATAALTATAIAAALDTELDATTTTYTVAANGSVVVLTQDVPAATTGVTLTVSTK